MWLAGSNTFWKMFFFQLQTREVITSIRKIPESIHQTQDEQDRGVDSHCDSGIALFNPVES